MCQEQLPDVAQCDLCDGDGRVTGDLDEDGYAIARRLRQRRHARQRWAGVEDNRHSEVAA